MTSATPSALFLGLDCSTQSLKASLLSASLELVAEAAVNFETHLPHFGTRAGVHTAPGGQVHSPAAMLVEAFDMLFEKMKAERWNLGDVRGVSASGQVRMPPAKREREGESSQLTPSLCSNMLPSIGLMLHQISWLACAPARL